MNAHRIRHLASLLPTNPNEAELRPLATELANGAAGKKVPARSIAKTVDHHLPSLPEEVRRRLREFAGQALRSTQTEIVAPPENCGVERWVSVDEASILLDILPSTLLERLKDKEYRRLYGWPYWDGHRWRIALPAIHPSSAANFRSTMPDEEPWTPPRWCRS